MQDADEAVATRGRGGQAEDLGQREAVHGPAEDLGGDVVALVDDQETKGFEEARGEGAGHEGLDHGDDDVPRGICHGSLDLGHGRAGEEGAHAVGPLVLEEGFVHEDERLASDLGGDVERGARLAEAGGQAQHGAPGAAQAAEHRGGGLRLGQLGPQHAREAEGDGLAGPADVARLRGGAVCPEARRDEGRGRLREDLEALGEGLVR